jgi:hypothetical protein
VLKDWRPRRLREHADLLANKRRQEREAAA